MALFRITFHRKLFSFGFLFSFTLWISAAHPVGSAIMILGGFGFLGRLHGLSSDNLVEAEVVLADGQIVVVNHNEHPGMCRTYSSIHLVLTGVQIYVGHYVVLAQPLVLSHATKSELIRFPSSSRVILSSEYCLLFELDRNVILLSTVVFTVQLHHH